MDLGPWVQDVAGRSTVPVLAALLIGVFASIGPCALATNVVALGYSARQFASRVAVVATGVLYAIGRAAAYAAIGIAVVVVGARIQTTARGLQDMADLVLGPLLVIVGLAMSGAFEISLPSFGQDRVSEWGPRVARRGPVGAFALGFLFALAFCPYTAALFFGIVVPMALAEGRSGLALTTAFGLGTAAPVIALGLPLALGIEHGANALGAVGRVDRIVRRVVAALFVAVGIVLIGRSAGIWSQ